MVRAASQQTSKAVPVGEIEPDKLYSLEAFKKASGLKDWALRSARKGGLKMHQAGNRKFVKGSDFIEYLESLGSKTA
ncbi:hypothetical protein F1728_22970 [Gimesia benthica]|uniref:DNA-binding protein n=1 Tax=Gimesia benthica TaxID=2608982 RepID=A0A6I6AJR2_9PLAN|nr:hypothetical protein [Gimesia benthica]QGQ25370.1 hypothetical protein F1728_22970 [Gimesia benthica]